MSALSPKADIEQTPDIGRRHGSARCFDHWLRSVLGEILEWRFHSALFLACDARLLQIELALDAPARLVGNFALSQQPVDKFTLGGNQVRSKLRDSRSSFESI